MEETASPTTSKKTLELPSAPNRRVDAAGALLRALLRSTAITIGGAKLKLYGAVVGAVHCESRQSNKSVCLSANEKKADTKIDINLPCLAPFCGGGTSLRLCARAFVAASLPADPRVSRRARLRAMSIMSYNGSAVIAMAGKNCVAIASDKRYGLRNQTISCEMRKTFQVNDKTLCGLTGLATDCQTLEQRFVFRTNMYRLREERDMSPTVFSNMVSNLLYERRFGPYFCEPVIAGLEGESNTPYLCGMDLLGAQVYTKDFILAGDCPEAMYGLCESMYKPDLEPDDLFEVIAQCLLSGVDRDCLAGWGCTVHVLTPEGLTTRQLKGRMD